jgi:hypothetical protein
MRFRLAAGDPGYREDFIDHYLLPVIYPSGLTRGLQIGLGIALLLCNISIYALVWYRCNKTSTLRR